MISVPLVSSDAHFVCISDGGCLLGLDTGGILCFGQLVHDDGLGVRITHYYKIVLRIRVCDGMVRRKDTQNNSVNVGISVATRWREIRYKCLDWSVFTL